MITERPDGVDPTVELARDASGTPAEAARLNDVPPWQPDPTRQDLPRRPRGGEPGRPGGTRDDGTSAIEHPHGGHSLRDDPYDDSYGDEPHVPEPYGDGSGTPGGRRGGRPPRRCSGRRWVRRIVYLLIFLIIGTPLFAAFRVWYVAREDSRSHSDAIIVLGAAQYNGRPSAVLEWRLLHVLKLYREGVAPAIVTVGGNRPGDNFTEAGTGKAWLNQHGVPNDRLVAVRSGSDTLQSMIAVGKEYKRLGWHTGVIVTDPWHALRSRTMADDNGIKAVTSPTRSGPTVGSRATQFRYIVRETGGYLYYVFIGRWHGDS